MTANTPNENSEMYDCILSYMTVEKTCKQAAEIILTISTEKDFLAYLETSSEFAAKLTRELVRLISHDDKVLTSYVCQSLINLSESKVIVGELHSLRILHLLVEMSRDYMRGKSISVEYKLLTILLANLFQHDQIVFQFLGIKSAMDAPQVWASAVMSQWLQKYLDVSEIEDDLTRALPCEGTAQPGRAAVRDKHYYCGYILVNLTRHYAARTCFLDSSDLLAIINQLCELLLRFPGRFGKCSDRTLSILQLIRHFVDDRRSLSQAIESDLCCVLCCLLYPPRGSAERRLTNRTDAGWLPGPIVYGEEEREVDPRIDEFACGLIDTEQCRELIAGILCSIVQYPLGRKKLRDIKAYNVIRIWHLKEAIPAIKSRIEILIRHLIFSEDEDNTQTSELEPISESDAHDTTIKTSEAACGLVCD